jgi:oligoribonuclease NrnB/cAMP/cGMP phosphodiesterase (DHH superfamily)
LKIAILHHADQDGFGAAFAAHTALAANHELLFKSVQYGEEPPYDELRAFAPQQVYILDFSYKAEPLKQIMDEFSVVVIDHHKTAAEELAEFPEIEVARFHEQGGVQYPIFRGVRVYQENSGCVLAWLFFMPDTDIPEILLYVQDRDLWKFDLEHSKEINAYIATLPFEFAEWEDFYTPGAYDAGKAILRFQQKQIEGRVKAAEMMTLVAEVDAASRAIHKVYFGRSHGGEDASDLIPCVNASENISELGEALCFAHPDAPFSMTYCDRPGGLRSYSLRSRNGFDVSEVAKAFGGGGHSAASGFSLPSPIKI